MQWYYAIREQQYGPVEEEDLRNLARSGQLAPDDLIWNPTLGDQWVRADRLPGLFPGAVPTVAPTAASGNTLGSPPAAEPAPMPDNSEITRRARAHLEGFWGLAIGVTLVQLVLDQLVTNAIPVIGPLISIFISGALTVGVAFFFLNRARNRPVAFEQMFSGFQTFGNALGAYILMALIVLAGFLLLIVPGIIFAIGLSFVFQILADAPAAGPTGAISRSWNLTRGHRWQLFWFGFRFLGWGLLCLLTLGIGFIWLIPYANMCYTEFYEAVRAAEVARTEEAGTGLRSIS